MTTGGEEAWTPEMVAEHVATLRACIERFRAALREDCPHWTDAEIIAEFDALEEGDM